MLVSQEERKSYSKITLRWNTYNVTNKCLCSLSSAKGCMHDHQTMGIKTFLPNANQKQHMTIESLSNFKETKFDWLVWYHFFHFYIWKVVLNWCSNFILKCQRVWQGLKWDSKQFRSTNSWTTSRVSIILFNGLRASIFSDETGNISDFKKCEKLTEDYFTRFWLNIQNLLRSYLKTHFQFH